jgi:hypothetical protein
MAVRYEGDDGNPDLELVDAVNTDAMSTAGKGYHGKLSTLLAWNKADPVDSFEIRRNNVIYNYQKNRNPFIDHPESAEKIWVTSGINEPEIPAIRVYPYPATNYIIIELPDYEKVKGVIFTITGEKIMVFEWVGRIRISMAEIKNGVYFFQAKSGNNVYRGKVIVD